jgi:G:T/U-mismatch repair DNA glycosylase
MTRKASFPPVVRADTRVLILGSLPGERSLMERRYYAHPRNLFWRLTGEAIGRELEALDYDARHNPLAELAATLPLLRAVAFNGAAAAKAGMALLSRSNLALMPLPSSSPANGAMPYAEKRRLWSAIGELLREPLASRSERPQ